jgi:hypothetical protein
MEENVAEDSLRRFDESVPLYGIKPLDPAGNLKHCFAASNGSGLNRICAHCPTPLPQLEKNLT